MDGSSTNLLILQISPVTLALSSIPSIMGVRKRDGMLGTDIFWRLGLLTAAAALPGDIGLITVTGLIRIPLGLPRFGEEKPELGNGSYRPGPGASGSGSLSKKVDMTFFCVEYY